MRENPMGMKLEKRWFFALEEEIRKPYIKELKNFLEKEKEEGYCIYPEETNIFRAFAKTPYDLVKIVIVGQDPYHGAYQAHGLSFSVPKGVPIPPSLRNIYQELKTDVGISPPHHGCLDEWAEQGVLLLNATLTVRAKSPRSHYGQGWERFTDAVIAKLCQRKDPLVFLLWGRSAREKCDRILSVENHPHQVLKSAHPSPYSAAQFFGCRHFSQANAFLKQWGKSPINWQLH